MVGPGIEHLVFVMAVVTLFLAWAFTPWLGLEAFLSVLAVVICVYLGFAAGWDVKEWLLELRKGRHSRDEGVR